MEIEDPRTTGFVPLDGAFNFVYRPSTDKRLPNEFNFGIDWTKGGQGQDILREHIREHSTMRVQMRGETYQGVFKHEWGFNTPDGMVIVEVV
jgi:hypothetical protein